MGAFAIREIQCEEATLHFWLTQPHDEKRD